AGHPLAALAELHVQFAGAVAALAADGETLENRLAVTVRRVGNVLGLVAVAEKAPGGDGPAKMLVARFVAGRQVPAASLREPGNRRFEQIAVVVDEVGPRPSSRTHGKLDLGLGFGQDPA